MDWLTLPGGDLIAPGLGDLRGLQIQAANTSARITEKQTIAAGDGTDDDADPLAARIQSPLAVDNRPGAASVDVESRRMLRWAVPGCCI